MHPIIVQSIVAEHVRDLRQTAKRNHDASMALDRQRRAPRAARAARLLPAGLRLHTS